MDLSLLGITTTPVVLLTVFVCIGAVKLVDVIFARDFASAAKIVICMLIGAVLGFFVNEFDVLQGIAIGLAASGLITTVTRLGRDSGQPVIG
jgi:hypothetical protein